ncbi:hypothetical protein CO665_29425 [Rhizobium anhuiense]|nr:hypothetical protein CO665_29425 [Rhizobium anhuiense]
MGSQLSRYQARRDEHGLYAVIDVSTGFPAEVGITSVLLTQSEADQLLAWLQKRVPNGPTPSKRRVELDHREAREEAPRHFA